MFLSKMQVRRKGAAPASPVPDSPGVYAMLNRRDEVLDPRFRALLRASSDRSPGVDYQQESKSCRH